MMPRMGTAILAILPQKFMQPPGKPTRSRVARIAGAAFICVNIKRFETAIPRHVLCPAQKIREDMVSPSPTSSFVYLEFST